MIGKMCMSIWMSEKDNYSWDIPPCINKGHNKCAQMINGKQLEYMYI